MNTELKAAAILLLYPDAQLKDNLDAAEEAITGSEHLSGTAKEQLCGFVERLRATPLKALQREYVETFDIGKRASLNLFEHMLGDSRERGAAMINLKRLYEDHGLEIQSNEPPDYLPMLLEFLSGLSWDEAMIYLASASRHLIPINTELLKEESLWQPVIGALLSLTSTAQEGSAKPERDDLMPELEADSFDKPVTFGGNADPTVQGVHWADKK